MPSPSPTTILLVDRRPARAAEIAAALSSPTGRCVVVASGAEALARLDEDADCAVVLLATREAPGPGEDAHEASQLIRDHPVLGGIPIYMIETRGHERERVIAALEAGAVDCLCEPVDLDVLALRVRTLIELHRRRTRTVAESTRQLMRSRASLDSLIENLPSMVFVKDARDLRFVRFNKAGEHLLGYPRASLIGKNDYDFFSKEQADFFTSKDRAVLQGRQVVDIPEERINTGTGERILHTRKVPLFGADGQPEFLLGISEDITDTKRAELERLELTREQAALEARESAARRTDFLAKVSTLLSSSLDYRQTLAELGRLLVPTLGDWCTVTVLAADGHGLERVAAAHADQARSALVEELVAGHPANIEGDLSVGHVIRTGKPLRASGAGEEALKRAASTPRHLELMRELGCEHCVIVPIGAGDKVHGAIAFVSAARERAYTTEDFALAEEVGRRAGIAIENAMLYSAAQAAIRARDEFLSIASHELKTPLTSLKLQVQLTQRAVDPERGTVPTAAKLAKVLDLSVRQIDRLVGLVDDLLDVTRVHAGRMSYNFERADLAEVAREVMDRLTETFTNARIETTIDATPTIVRCDRFRIDQVLVNLLTNAVKYGAGNPVDIRVRPTGEGAEIRVQDHGIGIDSAKLTKVFDRYERAVSHVKIAGLGLGLYISREIVKAHGGKIEVESELERGSTFVVRLPANPR